MNKFIVKLFIFTFCSALFSQTEYLGQKYDFTDEYGNVCVEKDKITFENCIEYGELESLGKYDFFNSSKTPYIILSYSNNDFQFLTLLKKQNSKFKYSSWEMPYAKALSKKYLSSKLTGLKVINADTFVTEIDKTGKTEKFLPNPWFNVNCNPWAVNITAESKIIYLKPGSYMVPNMKYADIEELIFINGFLSPEKPYLYEQNARARTVKIEYEDVSFVASLKDTGNYQAIKLPKKISRKTDTVIKLEILDVYEGEKYSDVVISGVLFMDAVVNKR